jgi:hypothetical protein
VQTIGIDRLLVKSSFSPTEVAQWLNDHDSHPWGEVSMSYQVRGPNHENPADIEALDSFMRPHPADRAPMNTSIALDGDTRRPERSARLRTKKV